jgi:hypothetical protein
MYCSRECQRIYPAERGQDHRSVPRDVAGNAGTA